jgi:hypothetical protein
MDTHKTLWFLFMLLSANFAAAAESVRVVHVLVALCDNEFQGIVKVPKHLGNGDDVQSNLYWGCSGGVRAAFSKNPEWELVKTVKNPRIGVLERAVYQHKSGNVFLVADAYRGRNIKQALEDFFLLLAGRSIKNEQESIPRLKKEIQAGSNASLVVYLGHNGLMDLRFESLPIGHSEKEAIILCCASEQYFKSILHHYGVRPVLLTTQLMYPGAMVLETAIEGWIKSETLQQIRVRAAEAYSKNQKISSRSAIKVFSKL